MKKLKLNLRNVGEVLTREQLKQIVGGSGSGSGSGKKPCDGKSEGDSCAHPSGGTGKCEYYPFSSGLVCNKRDL